MTDMEPFHENPSWLGNCPISLDSDGERISLSCGEGGRATRKLLHEHILPILGNDHLSRLEDAAHLLVESGRLAFTTDSFVVSPLFFPGGDIGTLAVYGTVNDLVVSGACPRWISLSLIIEEGLPGLVLDHVLNSIATSSQDSGVVVVAGDTKVVPKGAADGLFINTSGIGELVDPVPPGPAAIQAGDDLVVSGPIAQHGIAILACRNNLGFEPLPTSDCAPLIRHASALREAGIPVRAMRDASRGGVAAVLHEWSLQCVLTLTVDEALVPVLPHIRGACELLGLDPLHIANEGTMLIAVERGAGPAAADVLRRHCFSPQAAVIGRASAKGPSAVTVRRGLGREVLLEEPQGSPLPRIC